MNSKPPRMKTVRKGWPSRHVRALQAWDVRDFDGEWDDTNHHQVPSAAAQPSSNGQAHESNGFCHRQGRSRKDGNDTTDGECRFAFNDENRELTVTKADGFQFVVSAVPVRLGECWWFVKGGGHLHEWSAALGRPITNPQDARAASLAVRELRTRKPVVKASRRDQGHVLTLDPDKAEFLQLLSEVDRTKAEELRRLLTGKEASAARTEDVPSATDGGDTEFGHLLIAALQEAGATHLLEGKNGTPDQQPSDICTASGKDAFVKP